MARPKKRSIQKAHVPGTKKVHFEGPGNEMSERFNFWKNSDRDSNTFLLYRDDRDGKTFTRDKLEEILDEVRVFIYARIAAEWEANGRPPYTLEIEVKLDS